MSDLRYGQSIYYDHFRDRIMNYNEGVNVSLLYFDQRNNKNNEMVIILSITIRFQKYWIYCCSDSFFVLVW